MNMIYTIGHSTRPIDEFIDLLQAHAITQLVDIRTIPKSRHNPQYMQDALSQSLAEAGITYSYLKALGGLRKATKDSVNDAWRNASFRNYADYMQTPEFAAGIDELLQIADRGVTAIMCAEAVPWRCHRSLIGDALLVRGVRVLDIMSDDKATPHALTKFAVVEGPRVTYPAPAGSQATGQS